MILVLGSVTVKRSQFDQALALSQEHVHRSRTEPGCISHDVHIDSENRQRLVFVERWKDHPALMQHFAVPESNAFVEAIGALADSSPRIEIFDATQLET